MFPHIDIHGGSEWDRLLRFCCDKQLIRTHRSIVLLSCDGFEVLNKEKLGNS